VTSRLRLIIQYVSDDWLFIQKYSIHHGHETLEIRPPFNGVERDNGIVGGMTKIWEWHDTPVPSMQIPTWKTISSPSISGVTLRCDGRQYFKDRKLDEDELDRIAVILDAYKILSGE